MHLSFFPRLFHLQPHIYLPELNFSVFFIENTVPQNLNTIIIVNVLLSTNWKLNFYALMDKRNLHPALCYFICMYCPKLVIHSHQIKLPMASSVDYIISQMSLPFSKVLSLCTSTQNVKNIHIKFFPRVHFTSFTLEKTINLQTSEVNSTSLSKHNNDWIYQTTMGNYADVFSVP